MVERIPRPDQNISTCTEQALRYRWQRFLARRDHEIESLGEIVVLAQSVDDGAYSDERALTLYQLHPDYLSRNE